MRALWSVLLALLAAGCAKRYTAFNSPPRSLLADQPSSWQDTDSRGQIRSVPGSQADGEDESVVLASESAPPSPVGAVAGAVGGLFSGPASAPVAQVVTSAVPKQPEQLVIEAWIEMRIDDVAAVAAEIRARVEADGGRVVSENVIGPYKAASSAAIELRIPPAKAAGFQSWLASRGLVESRRILASDVSKQLFDQELALENLQLTMSRLQELAKKDVPMKELIEIETEMTRVRGQIERLKGEQRWLLDRVAFATITLTLRREGGPVEFAPHARIHPGAHLATLTLLDPDGRDRTRVGGGVTVHIKRYLTFDLDVFPSRGGDTRAVIGTIGGALYSSFLGSGRRRFGNPYLGVRFGYGYLSDEQCAVIGGELGLELYKHKYVQLSVAARTVAFLRDDTTDVALHGMFGFEVPF
jgi:hypothetical protein